jgi:hypothetical protein
LGIHAEGGGRDAAVVKHTKCLARSQGATTEAGGGPAGC